MESADAFCVTELKGENGIVLYRLVVLQFTTAEKHDIKVNGLKQIVDAFNITFAEKLFLFVTPVNGKLSKEQPYKTLEGNTTQLTGKIKEFKQYYCRYKI